MPESRPAAPAAPLDPTVERGLADFVAAAQQAFGPALHSVLLFGSAAEGRMRATSDVNLLLVLERFEPAAAGRLGEALRLARAVLDLHPMFLLRSELAAAMEAFALRFADIAARHRVLAGVDPFAGVELPREALVRRLRQVLLNLQIRLRERTLALAPREEQLARHLADQAGPLRAAAASLLQLQGRPAAGPKEALEAVVAGLGEPALQAALADLSRAREGQDLEPGRAEALAWQLQALLERLRDASGRL